jgi:hypothetical protein
MEMTMSANVGVLLHFAPAMVMLVIFGLNIALIHRRAERRSSDEASRFQAAVVAELRCLADMYQANLRLMRRGQPYLMSTRSALAVYRGNMGKLTLLERPAIECLVYVHSKNENIEIQLAARARSIKNGPAIVYCFEPNDPNFAELKRLYKEAWADVVRACATIAGEESVETAVESLPGPAENSGAVERLPVAALESKAPLSAA